jgi:hypothetical protein
VIRCRPHDGAYASPLNIRIRKSVMVAQHRLQRRANLPPQLYLGGAVSPAAFDGLARTLLVSARTQTLIGAQSPASTRHVVPAHARHLGSGG